MADAAESQGALFQTLFKRPILAVFDSPQTSSDGGSMLLNRPRGDNPARRVCSGSRRRSDRDSHRPDGGPLRREFAVRFARR